MYSTLRALGPQFQPESANIDRVVASCSSFNMKFLSPMIDSANRSRRSSPIFPDYSRAGRKAWWCRLAVPGRALHVVECCAVLQRRRDKGRAHGMRRIPPVQANGRWRASATRGQWRRGPCAGGIPGLCDCDLTGGTSARRDRRHGRPRRDRRGCAARHWDGWQARRVFRLSSRCAANRSRGSDAGLPPKARRFPRGGGPPAGLPRESRGRAGLQSCLPPGCSRSLRRVRFGKGQRRCLPAG